MGNSGHRRHRRGAFTEDLALLPDTEVVASRDPWRRGGRAFATRHGIRRPTVPGPNGDPPTPTSTVIYVATPHNAHHAAAKLCLEPGEGGAAREAVHPGRGDQSNLVDTARAANVFLMEAMWMRANPAIRRIQEPSQRRRHR